MKRILRQYIGSQGEVFMQFKKKERKKKNRKNKNSQTSTPPPIDLLKATLSGAAVAGSGAASTDVLLLLGYHT